MRPLYEYTLDALRQMVGISAIKQQEAFKNEVYESMTSLQFYNELCTVGLKGPRQCGHSSALVLLAKERFAGSTLIVTHNHGAADHMNHQIRNLIGDRNRIFIITGARGLRERYTFAAGTVDAIMVDNASYVGRSDCERVILDTMHIAQGKTDHKKPFFYIFVH